MHVCVAEMYVTLQIRIESEKNNYNFFRVKHLFVPAVRDILLNSYIYIIIVIFLISVCLPGYIWILNKYGSKPISRGHLFVGAVLTNLNQPWKKLPKQDLAILRPCSGAFTSTNRNISKHRKALFIKVIWPATLQLVFLIECTLTWPRAKMVIYLPLKPH